MTTNKRKNVTKNADMIFYNEVDGLCPFCLKKLSYVKDNSINKGFEVAHIYPLNPSDVEVSLLENEEKIASDVNDSKNLIALCGDCHKKFDTPRTIEDYRFLVKVKKEILLRSIAQEAYHSFPIEDQIKIIINALINFELPDEAENVEFCVKEVDKKNDGSLNNLTVKHIKNNISEYYLYIKQIFKEIDKEDAYSFDTISSQVKSMSNKLLKSGLNKEQTFNQLAEWIKAKTHSNSIDACEIVISFFIQNCEALS